MHRPVLLQEAIEFLNVDPDGIYIDATLGAGGHTEAILKAFERAAAKDERLDPGGGPRQGQDRGQGGRLLAIDRDPVALAVARERLQALGLLGENLVLLEGNFAEIASLHAQSGFPLANGLLADLGVSSMQLDDAGRGFSFQLPGPLDMRMNPGADIKAEEIVNRTRERDLADLIFNFGEERHSRRIARAIVEARPIRTTTELAQVVTRAIPSRAGLHQIHPATRTFQALRIAVNRELENLEALLARILDVLAAGGRCVIVSFHSLEDRLVKRAFQSWQREGRARILTRKVVRPSEEEIRKNPRARSAKLRAAEKCGR